MAMLWPSGMSGPIPSWVKTSSRSAATPARVAAPCHVGGRSMRARRSSSLVRLDSSAVGRRPVRPRASIVPAGVPRCLLRRLRLVWAMRVLEGTAQASPRAEELADVLGLRVVAVERDVGRESGEGGGGRQAHELGVFHRGVAADGAYDVGGPAG